MNRTEPRSTTEQILDAIASGSPVRVTIAVLLSLGIVGALLGAGVAVAWLAEVAL